MKITITVEGNPGVGKSTILKRFIAFVEGWTDYRCGDREITASGNSETIKIQLLKIGK